MINQESLIRQIAENRQNSPSRNCEAVNLGPPSTKKPVVVSAEDKRKRDILEDAKNALLYPDDIDPFEE